MDFISYFICYWYVVRECHLMVNGLTIRERLVIIETKLNYNTQWMRAIIIVVAASTGINIAI